MSSRDDIGAPRGAFAPLILPAAAVLVALLAGGFTAFMGAFAGYRAVYYVAVFGLLVVGGGIALTRAEPMRFVFLALVVALPVVTIVVPPGRLGLSVFEVATFMLCCVLLVRKALAPAADAPLFPARPLAIIWLLLVPCAVLARHPAQATLLLALLFAAYVFFWFALRELQRPRGPELLLGLMCVVLIVAAAGVFIDHFLHVRLSPEGTNLNQITWAGTTRIRRASGFFQDGQKAGAFLATLLAFLLVLAARRRFHDTGMRLLLWGAILIGTPALFLTVSRAAILALLVVSALVLLIASRWHAAIKFSGALVLLALSQLWPLLVPAALAERLAESDDDLQTRVAIWFDTWEMFADQPLQGIGFGGFQRYLLETRPGVLNYYGIGLESGTSYVPDQSESGYFTVLYETGLLGSAALLLLVGASLQRAFAGITRRGAAPAQRTELLAALAGLAVLAITFTTLFTTSDPRVLALFLLLLAVIWRWSPGIARQS